MKRSDWSIYVYCLESVMDHGFQGKNNTMYTVFYKGIFCCWFASIPKKTDTADFSKTLCKKVKQGAHGFVHNLHDIGKYSKHLKELHYLYDTFSISFLKFW